MGSINNDEANVSVCTYQILTNSTREEDCFVLVPAAEQRSLAHTRGHISCCVTEILIHVGNTFPNHAILITIKPKLMSMFSK